jgi:hypothetical protein
MSTSLNEEKPASSNSRRCWPDLVEHGSVDEFVREEHGVPRRLLGLGGAVARLASMKLFQPFVPLIPREASMKPSFQQSPLPCLDDR